MSGTDTRATAENTHTAGMVVGLLLAIAVLSGGLVLTYPLIYRGRILPGVEVEAVDLSSLTSTNTEFSAETVPVSSYCRF